MTLTYPRQVKLELYSKLRDTWSTSKQRTVCQSQIMEIKNKPTKYNLRRRLPCGSSSTVIFNSDECPRLLRSAYKTASSVTISTNEKCPSTVGRPRHLPVQIYDAICSYVRKIKEIGMRFNRCFILIDARNIIKKYEKDYTKKYTITISWVDHLLRRLDMVKPREIHKIKGDSKKSENSNALYEKKKIQFLNEICRKVKEKNIPNELIINIDEIYYEILPNSDISSSENSITILVGTTLSGHLLPFQLIYYKQHGHHSLFDFPKNWDISFTPNAKSNTESMLQYLESVLIRYIEETKEKLGCPDNQHALLILDKNGPHMATTFLNNLHNANICEIFVPSGETKTLQPIDVSKSTGESLKVELFEYLQEYCNQNNYTQISDIPLSDVKDRFSSWVVGAYDKLRNNHSCIKHGWKKSEIERIIRE